LRGVQAALAAAATNRDVPFAEVAALAGGEPLFRCLLLPAGVRSPAWDSDDRPEAAALGAGAAACDLVLAVTGAELQADFDPELFAAATVERLLAQVELVLRGMQAWPERRLAALPLVS